ncbi:MAG: hypothetical protein H0T83_10320 [Chthoniobacterales bacterium]|nr:hypothetical protein [Chthoniobacterales bacterium]
MKKSPSAQSTLLNSRALLGVVAAAGVTLAGVFFPTPAKADTATCASTPTQVVTDPVGDQGVGNATQKDITAISVGEDYTYIGSPRMVFVLKVANLTSIPSDEIWRVRFTVGATVYHVSMLSDANSNVSFAYGTYSGNTVSTLGGIEAGTYASDGTIKMAVEMAKVGSPAAATVITAINGVTQKNIGGTLFTGQDSTSNGTYTVKAKDAACTPVTLPPVGVNATYIKGGMTFSPSAKLVAPYIGQDVEPSLRVDKFGNTYIAPIRGVPGGTDLFYFDLRPTVSSLANPTYDPFMRNPIYRGQPDSISGSEDVAVGGDGGGDVDMAVGFNSEAIEDPNAPPTLAYSSLVLANISSQRSTDRGATFLKNPAGNLTGGVPGDDRQWMEFFGNQYCYIIYRTLAPAITQVQRSIDGGLTYGETTVVGTIGQVGGVDVDQNDGTVYIGGSNGVVAVGVPIVPGPPGPTSLPPATYTVYNVAGTGNAHLFFTVKVASDGTAYACYSDDHNILVKYSTNKGVTWSAPIRVSDGPETFTSVFPWLETGPTPGTVGVVWYGSDKATTGDDNADWHMFYALGTNLTGTTPIFRQVEAADHVIHAANISEAGLVVGGMSPNRNLADYFQIGFDPTGAAVIAFTDDHNDIAGHTYATRQISGPGANNGASIPAPVEGSGLPAPLYEPLPTAASVGGIIGSQVSDFRDDVRIGGNPGAGGVVVLPVDDPADILSVLYSAEGTGASPVLVCKMMVSDMTAIPPSTIWRMNFAANAPNSVVSPTGQFTFGLSDRGDQFYVSANTDATGVQTFKYGKSVRNFDGSITSTDLGNADSGAFDMANKTITVKVAVSKLNAGLAVGRPLIGNGSILAGLRATAITSNNGSGSNLADTARGGTQFQISFPVALASLSSVKTHGGAGQFAIDLPQTGTPNDECRSGGANGDYTLVFTFPNTLTSVSGATVTAGTGSVTSSGIGADTRQYIVNLTGVANAQAVTVTLSNVTDSASNFTALLPGTMRVLVGDTTNDSTVNSADIGQTKSQSGNLVSGSNFRQDVTVDGTLNSADIGLVKSKSGTALP